MLLLSIVSALLASHRLAIALILRKEDLPADFSPCITDMTPLYSAEKARRGVSREEALLPRIYENRSAWTLSEPRLLPRQTSSQIILYTISTYFHVVTDEDAANPSDTNYVSDQQILDQIAYMNRAYASAATAFDLIAVDRVVNATWAANGDDAAMRKALRVGTYDTLNVFVQSQFQSGSSTPGVPPGSILLGLGTPPVYGIKEFYNAPSAYTFDGVSLRSACITGGSLQGYNSGYILAHETGHWCGLYHTFQGDTCAADDFGDLVFDTPQQSIQGRGCPSSQDSCPDSGYTFANPISSTAWSPQGLAGPDPIHNFMDYTDEYCSTGFTPAQGLRIFNIIQLLRNGA